MSRNTNFNKYSFKDIQIGAVINGLEVKDVDERDNIATVSFVGKARTYYIKFSEFFKHTLVDSDERIENAYPELKSLWA